MNIDVLIKPVLDPDFVPAVLWNRAYRAAVAESGTGREIAIALTRPDGGCSVFRTRVTPDETGNPLTLRYLERILKFLLWQRGGNRILISGCDSLTERLAGIYSSAGARRFDAAFFGEKLYGQPLVIGSCAPDQIPDQDEQSLCVGRHLDGCRIGFDLGGSDRKCAAVVDGKVVFSDEVEWNPYFESDPAYHIAGINDSIKRAAAHLPRVDAIGGSAAGIYVNNEIRVASLFRGVPPELFDSSVRRLFFDLQSRWNDVPWVVVNDGEVTALAGSMSLNDNAVLGVAMGTSQAVGYCDADGHITPWLNELAFAPLDYRDDAPMDEWSGDIGCGVQYFSQQGIARLVPKAGLELPCDMPMAERLVAVQDLMKRGDDRARRIFETTGTIFGYALAGYAEFYDVRNLLLLGRVTSGEGGQIIIDNANEVLSAEFPELREQIHISMPDETMKRHGQAIAAASLPKIGG